MGRPLQDSIGPPPTDPRTSRPVGHSLPLQIGNPTTRRIGTHSRHSLNHEETGLPALKRVLLSTGGRRSSQGQNQPRGIQPICGERPRVWKEHQAKRGHRLMGSLHFSFTKEQPGPNGPWDTPTRTSYSSGMSGGQEPLKCLDGGNTGP